MSKIIIFILLVVLFAIGLVGFLFYRGSIFSDETLQLEILGQDLAKMGQEVEYTLNYKNNGKFILKNPKVIFEIPENSLTEDNKTRFEQTLPDLNPEDQGSLKFRARLLGKEGDSKVARAQLSYIPQNLSVRYEVKTEFTAKIEEVPMTLKYNLPAAAERGKEINYSIGYSSNIDYPLENLSIKVDPVEGLDIESSRPSSLDNSEWKLNTLNKEQGGEITIKGKVSGNAPDNLNLAGRLGVWRDGTFIVIKDFEASLEVIGPPAPDTQEPDNSEG